MTDATDTRTPDTLPESKPPYLTAREWRCFRARYGPPEEQASLFGLSQELGISRERARQIIEIAAVKVDYPDFAPLPGYIRYGLVDAGYTCGDDVARAHDLTLLAIKSFGDGALRTLRARWPMDRRPRPEPVE